MSDLKIPNLNKKSEKYLFKKKLSLRRKSKSKLLKESFLMLLLSNLILLVNYAIPKKKLIFDNLFNNINGLIIEIYRAASYFYEIFLAIFILISLGLAIILIVGAFTRISKIFKRKSKKVTFK